MRFVPELGEGFREHRATLVRRRFGAQEHEVAPRQAAESPEGPRPQHAGMHLHAHLLGDLRKLREDRCGVQAGVHLEKDIPAAPRRRVAK